jgi:hypothetical protein
MLHLEAQKMEPSKVKAMLHEAGIQRNTPAEGKEEVLQS